MGVPRTVIFPDLSLQNSFAHVHWESFDTRTIHMAVFMKSTQDVPAGQQYFLNAVAPSGRSIEPCVFLVAQGIADQAVCYAEKFLGDSCVAVNLLEEAAASVSEVIRAKETAQIAPIRDVRRYLFRVFLRKVAEARRNETMYEEASQLHSDPRDDSYGDGLDSAVTSGPDFGPFRQRYARDDPAPNRGSFLGRNRFGI